MFRKLLSLAALFFLILPASRAWAYRPFESTNAAVEEPNELEVQLGYFAFKRIEGKTTPFIPQLELDYGILGRFEAEGEFQVEESPEEGLQIEDPGIELKALLREGVLQKKNGPSIAVEAGFLLPSTEENEKDLGVKAFGILSERFSLFTCHINLGGGLNRDDRNPFALWGVIGEIAVNPTFRFVGEFNGEHPEGKSYDNTGLLGFIWYSRQLKSYFDLGVRKGISGDEADWEVTTGITFSLSFGSFQDD